MSYWYTAEVGAGRKVYAGLPLEALKCLETMVRTCASLLATCYTTFHGIAHRDDKFRERERCAGFQISQQYPKSLKRPSVPNRQQPLESLLYPFGLHDPST